MGFFDDLSKKASETYRNTAEKTNKITREMKLKSLINEDKKNIGKIYCEIGKKVYEKHIREENIDIESELAEECAKLDAYSKEIEDMNNEIRSLKNIRLCKVCASEISITARFCPKCGAVQEDAQGNSNNSNNTEVKENETASETNTTMENEVILGTNSTNANEVAPETNTTIENEVVSNTNPNTTNDVEFE